MTNKASAVRPPIRVVLCDDHPVWRDGVAADLGAKFEVVAHASDADEAIAAIDDLQPDLVVCDLHMPGGGGLRVVSERAQATKIVMLTVSEQESDLLEAVAQGARGYLLKSTDGDTLRTELLRAHDGEPVFSPSLAALLLGEFRRLGKEATGRDPLTEREREVLQEVARGYPYKQIGEHLHISPRTVENHVRRILDKLQLSRRQDLIRYAIEHGID